MEGKGLRQLAVRVDDETLASVDAKRMEIAAASGEIPTRSDIVRLALDAFLKAPGESGKQKRSK